MRSAVSCTRDGADWPKVVTVGAQQPISDFFGFIQIRDTLSTNGEHHRVAEVKSFPAISKSMRSVNGDQNGTNLKKWSVLLVRTIVDLFFFFFFFTLPQSKNILTLWACIVRFRTIASMRRFWCDISLNFYRQATKYGARMPKTSKKKLKAALWGSSSQSF